MKKRGDVPIFYLYIHYMIKRRYRSEVVSKKDATKYLFEWRIPKELRPIVMKELEAFGLLDMKHRREIKLFDSCFNMDNLNEYKEDIGCFEKGH